jgi:peptidoglycan/LPS O-acetylase OafA/YrhL
MLLIAIWKWGANGARLIAILLVATTSFVLNVIALSTDPTAAFYLPSSRMWELAVGSALAYATVQIERSSGTATARTPTPLHR